MPKLPCCLATYDYEPIYCTALPLASALPLLQAPPFTTVGSTLSILTIVDKARSSDLPSRLSHSQAFLERSRPSLIASFTPITTGKVRNLPSLPAGRLFLCPLWPKSSFPFRTLPDLGCRICRTQPPRCSRTTPRETSFGVGLSYPQAVSTVWLGHQLIAERRYHDSI